MKQGADSSKQLSKMAAKCWSDPAFKLYSDPAGTLKSQGIDVPPGVPERQPLIA